MTAPGLKSAFEKWSGHKKGGSWAISQLFKGLDTRNKPICGRKSGQAMARPAGPPTTALSIRSWIHLTEPFHQVTMA